MKKPIITVHKEFLRDNSGISVIESLNDFGFICKRFYVIKTSVNTSRGFHAHKKLKQIINCPEGTVKITIKGHDYKEVFILDSYKKSLYLPAGFWREIVMKKNSILNVMASEPYFEEDYIRDFNEYKLWAKEYFTKEGC